jgi:MFS family permease
LRGDSVLRPLALITVMGGVLTSGLVASLPVLALGHYKGGAAVAGWLIASLGAGTVAGNLFGYVLLGRIDSTRVAAYAFFGVGPPLLALSADLPLAVAVGALVLTGACASIVNAPMLTLLTLRTPVELRSSVMAAIFTLAMLGSPLGFLMGGWALELAGPVPFTLTLALAFSGLAFFFALVAHRLSGEPQLALAKGA